MNQQIARLQNYHRNFKGRLANSGLKMNLMGIARKSRFYTPVIDFLGAIANFYRANREQARKNQD